jgi:hypothetical protein
LNDRITASLIFFQTVKKDLGAAVLVCGRAIEQGRRVYCAVW